MKISEIGGEFGLIARLADLVKTDRSDVIAGIGDDAAVLQTAPAPAPYLLVTTDILVEGQHYRCDWSAPEQIGAKAVECNASDIAAMGGAPTTMFVSLVVKADTTVEWVEALYREMAARCRRYNIVLAGGDTSSGAVSTVNITLLGNVDQARLCLRSHARAGDAIMVTGPLGGSAAGLALLQAGLPASAYLREKHLSPRCRLDIAATIAPLANAMIDVSDGLAPEVLHIAKASGLGAQIEESAIPLHPDVIAAGQQLTRAAVEFALGGGEDFELLFTISRDRLSELEKLELDCRQVGEMQPEDQGCILVRPDGRRQHLKGGFDHFG